MKRIVSLLLTLIIAMSFLPSAYAEDSGDVFEITCLTTGSYTHGYYSKADVKNLTSVSQTGVLVVASYSADGKFLESSSLGIFIPGNSYDTYTLYFESKPSSIQKAFIMDSWSSPVPISGSCTLTVTSKEFSADTYYPQYNLTDAKQYATGYEKIRFGDLHYEFENTIDLYVNDVFYKTVTASADIAGADLTPAQTDLDWILGNAHGDITITKSNPAEGYDAIFVNFYQIAKVASVDSGYYKTVIALHDVACSLDDSSYNLDEIIISREAVDEGDVIVTVTRNGKKATLDSLVNDDIIAYATDFTDSTIENPKKIDIIATNNKTSGPVVAIDKNDISNYNDNEYTINKVAYTLVPSLYRGSDPNIYLTESYILTLDPFGRIYDFEIDPYATSYAIALTRCAEEPHIKLLLSDGTVKTYEVDTAIVRNYKSDFVDTDINTIMDVADRVVTYEVSSRSGKIISIAKVAPTKVLVDTVYKSRTSLLGSGNKILDITPMICLDRGVQNTINTNDPDKYSVLAKSHLLNNTEYSGYVYRIGTTVTFVVITSIGMMFDEDSRFAVAIDTPADVLTEDGDSVKSVKVLYEGEVQELYFPDNGLSDNIKGGDVFFFTTNSDGYADAIYTPTEGDPVWEDMIKGYNWSYNIWDDHTPIQFAQGVVTEVTSNSISFATIEQVESGYLDTNLDLDDTHADGVIKYWFADDHVAYTYDSTMKTRVDAERYDVTSSSSIKVSEFDEFDNGNGVLNDGIYQGDLMSKATTATVMIVDDEIVAIFAYER